MARTFTPLTLEILSAIKSRPEVTPEELWENYKKQKPYKEIYNAAFRLEELGLVKKDRALGELLLTITADGERILQRARPERDGVWKLVIFDIPEKQKYVRTVLRAKLKSLHFKKWQNSIWVSPYALDEEVEGELGQLAKKFFVRLIKTTQINHTEDLEKLFQK